MGALGLFLLWSAIHEAVDKSVVAFTQLKLYLLYLDTPISS